MSSLRRLRVPLVHLSRRFFVLPIDGKTLHHFLGQANRKSDGEVKTIELSSNLDSAVPSVLHSYNVLPTLNASNHQRTFSITSYGCQMNLADTEIVSSVLHDAGYVLADEATADVVLLNTCAIREHAEQKIWKKLEEIRALKKERQRENRKNGKQGNVQIVGMLGCMAERLKEKVLNEKKLVDIVAGPDAYRTLPELLKSVEMSQGNAATAINVQLSMDETYADIIPMRQGSNGVSAYVSISRGCNNMCSYCIVPYTRGKERSRPYQTIIDEIASLSQQGYKEVTLLGQNVNSYCDLSEESIGEKKLYLDRQGDGSVLARGFKSIWKYPAGGVRFAELLDRVADVDPNMRIRFVSPHPKDFGDDVLRVVASRHNVCKQLHIPAQSGCSDILAKMRRGYSRESYLELIGLIKGMIPTVSLTSDFIVGFPTESEESFLSTLSLIQQVGYAKAFMYSYSEREKTHAHRTLKDDISDAIKAERMIRISSLVNETSDHIYKTDVGRLHVVLIDGNSRRSDSDWVGRTDTNRRIVFPKSKVPVGLPFTNKNEELEVGDYAAVHVQSATSHTLKGVAIAKIEQLRDFFTFIAPYESSKSASSCIFQQTSIAKQNFMYSKTI